MVSTTKNTFYLLIAYTYQKLIALFYFIFLARYLGVDDFGKYTFAISFVLLFSVLIDFGLFPVLTREIARDKKKTKVYFGNILTFNLLAGFFVFFLIYIVINILDYSSTTKALVYLSSLAIFLDSLALCVYQVFRGHINLKYESIGIIVHKTVMLIFGMFLIYLKAPVVLIALPLVIASFFYIINAIIFLKTKLNLWPIPYFSKPVLKKLLVLAWPFFIAAVFSRIYATGDTILLSYLSGDKFVGWYMAAQKLVLSFLVLVAGSLSAALYPAFSYYFVRSKEYLDYLFHRGVFYLMLITIPLVFGLLSLSKNIILFIYGQDYISAASSLTFLTLAIPFIFLDYIISSFLNACDKQKLNTFIHGIGASIFIILNLILIPLFYHLGAAIAVLISFIILFIMEIYSINKILKINKDYLLKKTGIIFIASIIMGTVLIFIRDYIHVLLSVAIGIIVYIIISYIFGLIKKKDVLVLKDLIRFKKE